ncbi:MAG TPA: hypothetical protein VF736_17560 [Pyrinomonadaceae bacterium]|jgi:hypothetical protein
MNASASCDYRYTQTDIVYEVDKRGQVVREGAPAAASRPGRR